MAQALLAKTIDVGELCSTQPDIALNGWVVLPGRQADPAGRQHRAAGPQRLPGQAGDKAGFEAILNAVSAKMDTATLTKLNAEFTVHKKDIATIAKAWLSQAGLVP